MQNTVSIMHCIVFGHMGRGGRGGVGGLEQRFTEPCIFHFLRSRDIFYVDSPFAAS